MQGHLVSLGRGESQDVTIRDLLAPRSVPIPRFNLENAVFRASAGQHAQVARFIHFSTSLLYFEKVT